MNDQPSKTLEELEAEWIDHIVYKMEFEDNMDPAFKWVLGDMIDSQAHVEPEQIAKQILTYLMLRIILDLKMAPSS